MAHLIQPNSVKVVTKDGEITVSLQIDLNINLNQHGALADTGTNVNAKVNSKKTEDEVAWAIPDFKPSEKINFGK